MKYFDRVKETCSTEGTGALTLTGADIGYKRFGSVLSLDDTVYYAIISREYDEWEIGIGTYSGTNTLTRTTVLDGTNGESKVDFSAGTKDVFITVPAYFFDNLSVTVDEDAITLSDVTTLNVSTSKHGLVPKAPDDNTKFLRGDASWAVPSVAESALSLSDNTTGDVSTSKHGFAPKAPDDTEKFLRGDGTWAVPLSGNPVKQTSNVSLAQNASTTVTGTTVVAVYELAAGANLVPTMTSNTAPSGTVSGSSSNGSTYAEYKAFDKISSAQWMATAIPCWLKYDFGYAVTVASYTIDSRARTDLAPKTWILEGSNDGSNWTTLDSQSNITSWGSINSYNIASPGSYRYYRISISVGISGTYCTIAELTLNSAPAYQVLIPGTDYLVSRTTTNGSQTLTVKRLKAGTFNHVIDYI